MKVLLTSDMWWLEGWNVKRYGKWSLQNRRNPYSILTYWSQEPKEFCFLIRRSIAVIWWIYGD